MSLNDDEDINTIEIEVTISEARRLVALLHLAAEAAERGGRVEDMNQAHILAHHIQHSLEQE